jgi:hypothetical protein
MNRSSMGGIFLSVMIFSIIITIIPSVYAESINAKSIGFEETIIIEFTNEGKTDVNSFRIWLGSDFSFKSFKTEKGWIGEKTPQGVIIFTSKEEVVKPGQSIKIGVKTDKITNGINWKALDKNENQISTGKTIVGEIPIPVETPKTNSVTGKGILSNSEFRIIPERPNVGGTIRVIGDNFEPMKEFDFIVDSRKVGSFVTNEAGHFITTMKIPNEVHTDRVDFVVKDKNGDEKKISLRIGQVENRVPETENIELTFRGIPSVVHRGDFLEISGTGSPGKGITIEIFGPDGEFIRTRTAEIDSKGNWSLEPLLVPLDRPFGKYTGTISDGRQTKTAEWRVESSKVIIIQPENLRFEPGSIMKFNGTALPNQPLDLILKDPLGIERYSDIIQVGEAGDVNFEYKTIANVDKEGTWTLIATQGKNKEFTYAGLGENPTIPINLEFDKLNYKSSEKALITFSGKPSELLTMIIIDPSDKPKKIGDATSIPITLKPDGRGNYELDLKGYSSGVYTAVISKGSSKTSQVFTVGLQTGSGSVDINTTKLEYGPGDPILILGSTNPNTLLTVTMYNESGEAVKVKETFSDKNGKISESGFRIPTEAKPGKWQLKATSGSNFDVQDITVSAVHQEGMVITVVDGEEVAGVGKSITIRVLGAEGTVNIKILAEDGTQIEELQFPSSGQGEINLPWIIPKDTVPGTYKLVAKDAKRTTETTYVVK